MLAHAHKHKARQQPSHVTHFVSIHLADAAGISARTGIPAEVILAQFALETNWVEQ
jgi:flagellum-specific peptidoglycan hydrolase FlgJ